jgi:hypothetical protein
LHYFLKRAGALRIPILRLVGPQGVIDEDTPMLYDYLNEHHGICAVHTSATGMGTDRRETNPQYEPFVEVYQVHRQSYEHLGPPARRGDSKGMRSRKGIRNAGQPRGRPAVEKNAGQAETKLRMAKEMKRLRNMAAAIGYYKEIVEKFADSPQATIARERCH